MHTSRWKDEGASFVDPDALPRKPALAAAGRTDNTNDFAHVLPNMPLSSRSTTPTPLALIPPGFASHNSQQSVSTTTSSTVTATSPQNSTSGGGVSRSSSTDDFFRSAARLEQAGRVSPTLRKAPSSNVIDGAHSSRYTTADSNSSVSRVSLFDNPQAEVRLSCFVMHEQTPERTTSIARSAVAPAASRSQGQGWRREYAQALSYAEWSRRFAQRSR